jgi:predicted RNase H-like nuclease (RuvC/YqgF family)
MSHSPLPNIADVTEELRDKALKRTAETLRKVDEVRRALELPVDQLSLVLEAYGKSVLALLAEAERAATEEDGKPTAETAEEDTLGILTRHSATLMRTNQQMFDGTIRVLGQQNMHLHEQVNALKAENEELRTRFWELRNKE